MNAFDKPWEELTDNDMAELEAHDWTAAQIITAMSMALEMGDMEAHVALLGRLATKDPRAAAAVLAVIEAGHR